MYVSVTCFTLSGCEACTTASYTDSQAFSLMVTVINWLSPQWVVVVGAAPVLDTKFLLFRYVAILCCVFFSLSVNASLSNDIVTLPCSPPIPGANFINGKRLGPFFNLLSLVSCPLPSSLIASSISSKPFLVMTPSFFIILALYVSVLALKNSKIINSILFILSLYESTFPTFFVKASSIASPNVSFVAFCNTLK